MINNRQNGRRRGRGGGAGGAPRPNGGNGAGAERGNRIDNRARGNAAQLHEKYKALARDAQMQGDRVSTEYYLQFSDHYFRVLAESRSRFEEQQPRPRRDDFMSPNEGDEEYGDEGELSGTDQRDEQPSADRGYAPRNDGNRYGNEGDGRREESRDDDRGRRPPRRDQAPRADNGDGYGRPRRDQGMRQDGDAYSGSNQSSNGNGQPSEAARQPRDGEYRGEDRSRRPRREPNERSDVRVAQEASAPISAPSEPVRDAAPRGEERIRRPRREQPTMEAAPVPPVAEVAPAAEDSPIRAKRGRRPAASAVEDVSAEAERIQADRLPPAFALTPPPSDPANDADEKPRRRVRRARTGDGTAADV